MVTRKALLRTAEVCRRRARSRSSHYNDIADGLFVPPIPIGDRAVATPEHEVDTLISAQIAGKSKEELRALVKELIVARKAQASLQDYRS